VICKLQNASP